MTYRTILVHADLAPAAQHRVELACTVALDMGAHLIGVATTGISRFLQPGAAGMSGGAIAEQLEALRDDARRALDGFDAVARRAGVPSVERQLCSDDTAGGLALQARYCDLAVLSQTDPDAPAAAATSLPAYVMLHAARPVLVVPYLGRFHDFGRHALVAWDGGIEATRAVAAALPLLRRAALVTVAVFNASHGADHGDQPGADLALYLSRHGIAVTVAPLSIGRDIGEELLSTAADVGAGLLVMGGYGHARLRELLLGGVTETVLRRMTLPVLMMH
ncbi:universal stress protein [Pseudoduganella armeniaca]|uniref:Universal stress protein n=1 Tax=Pseudoduganella armeniaca TaxID=2072590 RepID=A0A2R4C9Z2_9BURK|nr:universal stress protein [Pseudoduganella armeniaca]AVR96459.1 universal stress protein [Pseudoduganella armeniaca]